MQDTNPLDEYFSKGELAAVLKKSTRTLDRWLAKTGGLEIGLSASWLTVWSRWA